jgi:multicomponent K+:H+ antiporter subunit E
MKRLLPSPLLSSGLLVLWILLMESASAGTLAFGAVLAIFWPAVTASLRPAPVRVRKPLVIARLLARVVGDMLRANLHVARTILTGRQRDMNSGFVRVPLDLEDPNGLAVLAMIITFTPGTAWVQLSPDGRTLLIHVLTLAAEPELVQSIKADYERPLMEIFQ